jgi:hypothetical protein
VLEASSVARHEGVVPLPFPAVVVLDDGQPNGTGIPLATKGVDEHQVAEALRHLVAVHVHHRHVHPVAHEGFAGGRLALCTLAFVVREDEVAATTMQVDGGSEFAQCQSAALDVPAGPAGTPHGVPTGFVGLAGVPQHEVERVALVRVVGLATPLAGDGDHLGLGELTDGAEIGEPGDVEVHAATGLVGVAAVEHHSDEAADVGDGRRGARGAVHRKSVQRLHVALEPRLLAGGEIEVMHTELTGLGEQRIVDVGDVAHAPHRVAHVDEATLQDVVVDEGGRVPEVGGVVGRDAARVHQHLRARLERHHRSACRVVQPHRHEPDATAWESSGAALGARGSRRMPVSFGATLVL